MAKTPPREVLGRLAAARPLDELAQFLRAQGVAQGSGLWGSSVAAVATILRQRLGRPLLLVCGHIDEADDLADDVELFSSARPEVLPALELSGALGHQSEEQVANRMQLVARLAGSEKRVEPVIVAPIQALMQPVPSRSQLADLIREVRSGRRWSRRS
jgi:transcription-repair coupling factor (superfamily II helicase)